MALLVLASGIGGCGEGLSASELEGTYAIVEREEGPCEGPLEPNLPSPDDRHFQLVEEDRGGEPLLAYYGCEAPDDCSTTRDLLRSFGRSGGGWEASLANAESGCVLRFRRRALFATESGVEIVQTVYRETDDSLPIEECTDMEANRRGDAMPCVSVVEIRAERIGPAP